MADPFNPSGLPYTRGEKSSGALLRNASGALLRNAAGALLYANYKVVSHSSKIITITIAPTYEDFEVDGVPCGNSLEAYEPIGEIHRDHAHYVTNEWTFTISPSGSLTAAKFYFDLWGVDWTGYSFDPVMGFPYGKPTFTFDVTISVTGGNAITKSITQNVVSSSLRSGGTDDTNAHYNFGYNYDATTNTLSWAP